MLAILACLVGRDLFRLFRVVAFLVQRLLRRFLFLHLVDHSAAQLAVAVVAKGIKQAVRRQDDRVLGAGRNICRHAVLGQAHGQQLARLWNLRRFAAQLAMTIGARGQHRAAGALDEHMISTGDHLDHGLVVGGRQRHLV